MFTNSFDDYGKVLIVLALIILLIGIILGIGISLLYHLFS